MIFLDLSIPGFRHFFFDKISQPVRLLPSMFCLFPGPGEFRFVSSQDIFLHIHTIYIPGTQMTLVLLEKGLVLEGSTPKIEDKQVPGTQYQLQPCFLQSYCRWTDCVKYDLLSLRCLMQVFEIINIFLHLPKSGDWCVQSYASSCLQGF